MKSPRRIEKLIVLEIKKNPQYLVMFFKQLPFVINRNWINFQNLSSITVNFFKQKMIELPVLDWHMQDLLLVIGRDNFKTIMDVLIGRIKKNTKKKKEGIAISDFGRFETIPYHFNPKLGDHIAKHSEYKKYAIDLIDKMTMKPSVYNAIVTQFMQRIELQ